MRLDHDCLPFRVGPKYMMKYIHKSLVMEYYKIDDLLCVIHLLSKFPVAFLPIQSTRPSKPGTKPQISFQYMSHNAFTTEEKPEYDLRI
jgi:hypothetical protein